MARKKTTKRKVEPGDFGLYLAQIRHKRGFTQLELSKAIGCHPSYVHKLETGWRDVPQTIFLCRLALVLGVPLHEILANGKLIARCDNPALLNDTVSILESWRAQVKIQDAAHMAREVTGILAKNRHRMATDIHHLIDALTKHVTVLESELLPHA